MRKHVSIWDGYCVTTRLTDQVAARPAWPRTPSTIGVIVRRYPVEAGLSDRSGTSLARTAQAAERALQLRCYEVVILYPAHGVTRVPLGRSMSEAVLWQRIDDCRRWRPERCRNRSGRVPGAPRTPPRRRASCRGVGSPRSRGRGTPSACSRALWCRRRGPTGRPAPGAPRLPRVVEPRGRAHGLTRKRGACVLREPHKTALLTAFADMTLCCFRAAADDDRIELAKPAAEEMGPKPRRRAAMLRPRTRSPGAWRGLRVDSPGRPNTRGHTVRRTGTPAKGQPRARPQGGAAPPRSE